MVIDCKKIEYLKNQNFNTIKDAAIFAFPTIACAQGKAIGTFCRQMQRILALSADPTELLLYLFELDQDTIFGAFVLNFIPGGEFSGVLDSIFSFYSLGTDILQHKPNVPDLDGTARLMGVTDKKQFRWLKRQITQYWLESPEYPNGDRALEYFQLK